MHPNPAFRATSRDRNIAFARARGFGTLAVNDTEGPRLAHVPYLLAPDAASADLHLVRSNPIARMTHPREAVIAVTGGDGYVSPDWYGVADQVPTWNYVAVHLRGRLTALPQEGMRDMLDRQSAAYEAQLDKTPWRTAKMTPEVLERMMQQILPFRLEITEIDGTWKLSQNKPEPARHGAAAGLRRPGPGMGRDGLADLVDDPPQP